MKVTLKQVAGKKRDRESGEIVEVLFSLDWVYLDGEQGAQIRRRSGAIFCPLPHVHESLAADIIKQIDAIREKEGFFGPCAVDPSMAPSETMDELLALDEDGDDDNEEEEI